MKDSKLVSILGVITSFTGGLAAIQWTQVGSAGQKIAIAVSIIGAVAAALGKALGEER